MINFADISDGKEPVKIAVENSLDDQIPNHFVYVRVNVPSASFPSDDFEVQYSGCECCTLVNTSDTLCANDDSCLCVHLKSFGPSYDSCRRLLAAGYMMCDSTRFIA